MKVHRAPCQDCTSLICRLELHSKKPSPLGEDTHNSECDLKEHSLNVKQYRSARKKASYHFASQRARFKTN
eukprot:c29249_g1_i1 orf=1-210(-)